MNKLFIKDFPSEFFYNWRSGCILLLLLRPIEVMSHRTYNWNSQFRWSILSRTQLEWFRVIVLFILIQANNHETKRMTQRLKDHTDFNHSKWKTIKYFNSLYRLSLLRTRIKLEIIFKSKIVCGSGRLHRTNDISQIYTHPCVL